MLSFAAPFSPAAKRAISRPNLSTSRRRAPRPAATPPALRAQRRAPSAPPAPATQPPTPPRIPSAFRNAAVVIVGGGPTGLVAAILLAHRGVPVTVLERSSDYSRIDKPRSYALTIQLRGRRVLKTIPGLYDHVAQGGVLYGKTRVVAKGPDRAVFTREMRGVAVEGDKDLNIMLTRASLAERLKTFADRYDNLTVVQGALVTDIRVREDTRTDVCFESAEGKSVLPADLVLSCDGKNSVVTAALARAAELPSASLYSANGLGTQTFFSGSSGILIKSIVMSEDFFRDTRVDSLLEQSTDLRVLRGAAGDRPERERFNAQIFPLSREQVRRLQGYLVSIAERADNAVWQLNSVEDGYKLFEENFPQVRVRECIKREDMEQFIAAKPLTTPPVMRSKSLVVHMNTVNSGAAEKKHSSVVFLGDSAHCFPPDLAQGLNSALEDLNVFFRVVDEADDEASIENVLDSYEQTREADVKALMQLATCTNPYRFLPRRVGRILTFTNFALRRKLAKVLPGVIHPSMPEMLSYNYTYAEIARKANMTSTRLLAGLIVVGTLLSAAVFKLAAFALRLWRCTKGSSVAMKQ